MARQLVEFRTPAAYTGVENYAHSHAGTEPGALAWFAIGYAHYLDAHYPRPSPRFRKRSRRSASWRTTSPSSSATRMY